MKAYQRRRPFVVSILVTLTLLLDVDHSHSLQSRNVQVSRNEGRLAFVDGCWNRHTSTRMTAVHALIQRLRPASTRTTTSLFAGAPDEEENSTQTKHRRKKNKYEKFSKISQNELDPLEAMIAESKEKVQALQVEIQKNKKSRWKRTKDGTAVTAAILQDSDAAKIEFPDTKEINPYDPTTFGYIEIGHMTGAHGVHGWIKLESTTAFSQQRLCTAGIRHLKPPKKRAPRQVVLLQGKHRLHDEYLIRLQDVDDRDTALSLRGSTLYVREEDIDAVSTTNSNITSSNATSQGDDIGEDSSERDEEEEEYFIADLVGLDVFLQDDPTCFVGKVGGLVLGEEMCSVPGLAFHDMLEVTIQKGPMPSFRDELVLIPFVPDIVPRVALQEESIFIQPPAGLLNLTYVRQEKVRIKAFLPPSGSSDED